MSDPRYSVLYNSCSLQSKHHDVERLLHSGIKVIWFGSMDDIATLEDEFEIFSKCRLLQTFVSGIEDEFSVVDGDIGPHLNELSRTSEHTTFDLNQYLVEHSRSKHLIVEASAGTGKTSVMIDRIMYLLHTEDGLEPSQIAMITFTREAADQMSRRLQETLMNRYSVTNKQRYLELLELQSQMQISTIHSFALKMIKELGFESGFTKDVRIRSFRHDIDNIILSELDNICDDTVSISSQLGIRLHEAQSLIHNFWDRMMQLGIDDESISRLEWGETPHVMPSGLQPALKTTINHLPAEYRDLKLKSNAVSLSDMVRDLNSILKGLDSGKIQSELRYLFVDEFQDSDDSQIQMVLLLTKLLNLSIFVVGDIKQSIYRFRGADDSAFSKLRTGLESIDKTYGNYRLMNNYRSSPTIIDGLDIWFRKWYENGVLEYDEKNNACKLNQEGQLKVIELTKYDSEEAFLSRDLKKALDDLKINLSGKDPAVSDKVVVLTRSNSDLHRVDIICRRYHIPVIVKQSGAFYTSDAVRDFYSVVSSFVFHDPIHAFNFLISPYSDNEISPDIEPLLSMEGNRSDLQDYLDMLLEGTDWGMYRNELNERPIMSVMMEMIEREPILENYASSKISKSISDGFAEADARSMALASSIQYKADLDKLLKILQRNLRSGNDSLYDLYSFLNLMIHTNREEECADTEVSEGPNCVYCMTVHKAKGLEFDTVIIPFTNNRYLLSDDKEILVQTDDLKVGWKYTKKDDTVLQNNNYRGIRIEENSNQRKEEARILYVATTRAIRNLTVYVKQEHKKDTWASLIKQGEWQ